MTRKISVIAKEIERDWTRPYFGAVPYLEAMRTLDTVDQHYGVDSAVEIIVRFLSNARTWRGEFAKRIKKELNDMVKGKSF